jgi:hypothetical protein
MSTRRPAANPFLEHALVAPGDDDDGTEATGSPRVRFPPTFAVTQEGPNRMLYMAPVGLDLLQSALALPDTDQALVLDGRAPRVVPWGDITELATELDLVHLPAGAQRAPAVPEPLLAAPARAVPPGSRIAVSLHDRCHGVLLSPEPALLDIALRRFIEAYLGAATGPEVALPTLPDSLVSDLITPDPDRVTCILRLDQRERYWVLEFAWTNVDGEPATVEQWVAEARHGRWRAGWSW